MISKSERQVLGKTFQATSNMSVIHEGNIRNMKMKVWIVGREKALVKVLEPEKDRGTGNLRLELNLWQYLPKVDRVIKIPSSLLLQSWMGSDFTNDDLVKGSSLVRDYTHAIVEKTSIAGTPTTKIICKPKKDAPVVWGRVEVWLRATDAVPLRYDYYSEGGELLKSLAGEKIKNFGDHTIPSILIMKDMRKNNYSTKIEYDPSTVKFDQKIPEDVFTQQHLRKPVTGG